MFLPFWEINPEEVVTDNLDNNELSLQKVSNIQNLIQAYKDTSAKINKIGKINDEQNFVDQVDQLLTFFDLEAYLAELYFYLNEGIELLDTEKNIIDVINRDYKLSYHYYLEDEVIRKTGGLPLVKIWLAKE